MNSMTPHKTTPLKNCFVLCIVLYRIYNTWLFCTETGARDTQNNNIYKTPIPPTISFNNFCFKYQILLPIWKEKSLSIATTDVVSLKFLKV